MLGKFVYHPKPLRMKPTIFTKAETIWKRLSQEGETSSFQFSLEVHKRLLAFFQVGDYYYFLFNIRDLVFEQISPEIKTVLGWDPEEVDVPFFMGLIHPDDQPWFLNFENKATEFVATVPPDQVMNYKIRFDYRMRKKNGDYIRILHQVIAVDCKDNAVIRSFGIHTDITHLKPEGKPMLSFIGLNGQPSYIDVSAKNVFKQQPLLTRREQEVLALLVDGKTSDEIGKLLFISPLTVQVHRKNLLQKTGCVNTPSLISQAITKGLV